MKTEHAKRIYFEQLKHLVTLPMVLSRYGIELRRQGQQLYGPCPIHRGKSKRQFSVNPATSEWHCFGDCQRGGAMLEFVAAMEQVDVLEAARLVARWFAIGTSNQHHSQQQQRSSKMSEGRSPDWKVVSPQEREGKPDFNTRIGSGWNFTTKDNRPGVSIKLSALPIGDRIVLYKNDDESDDAQEDAKSKKRK